MTVVQSAVWKYQIEKTIMEIYNKISMAGNFSHSMIMEIVDAHMGICYQT